MRDDARPGFRALLLAAGLLLAGATSLPAQSAEWYELSSRRQVDSVTSLEADMEYAVGRLEVAPADEGLLYRMDLRYDARRFEPARDWTTRDGTGRLAFQLRAEDGDMDLDDFDDVDSDEMGSLRLGLSTEVPTRLSLGVMAAEADLELGGVALERFVFRTGASEAAIDFDRPNPVRMDRLELAAGAADFEANGLGNARFEHFEFVGAVGDVRLDFRGEWSESAEGEIRMGLGALHLVFPRDIGVRIEKRGILASFDSAGFEQVDDVYQTENWGAAAQRLTLSVRAGFGDIDVDFVD
ncbi:MAG: hypothetical protein ACODAA_09125 [Gemmatimonadota bacterium]